MKKKAYGFTIVELLIVIIAILAAITLVSYNGITQRANNSAIISAAEQSYKLIEAYIAANGAYPLTTDSGEIRACITSQSGCSSETSSRATSSDTLDANLKTIGSAPTSIVSPGTNAVGIRYSYVVTRTYNGKSQPVVMSYYLLGADQQCRLADPTVGSGGVKLTTADSGNSGNATVDGRAKTICNVSVPGPSV